MSALHLDWQAVLTGQPAHWLLSGLGMTLSLTLWGGLLAMVIATLLLALRLSGTRWLSLPAQIYVLAFRNTPLAVQLLAWYFGGLSCLPDNWREWLNNEPHLGPLALPTPEVLVGIWALGLFSAAFLAEDLRAGVGGVPKGQLEAARSQGFSYVQALRYVVLPQALRHAWQPLIGQWLNLMKNSSLTMSIAVAELMYQTNQVESFNLHSIESYAVASAIYLLLGVGMSLLLQTCGQRLFAERTTHAR